MELFINNLAPIMFLGLIFFLLLGFPVAFSLGACGLFFGFVGVELGVLPEALLQALPLRIFGISQLAYFFCQQYFSAFLVFFQSGVFNQTLQKRHSLDELGHTL